MSLDVSGKLGEAQPYCLGFWRFSPTLFTNRLLRRSELLDQCTQSTSFSLVLRYSLKGLL